MSRPILAALAVVLHEEQVLLVRRRNPPDAGLWGFPGGKVELGESVATAALRELREETAIEAKVLHLLDGLDVIGRVADGVLAHHYYLVAMACRYVSGTLVAGDDAEEARWWPLDQVLSSPDQMSAGVGALLEKAKSRRG